MTCSVHSICRRCDSLTVRGGVTGPWSRVPSISFHGGQLATSRIHLPTSALQKSLIAVESAVLNLRWNENPRTSKHIYAFLEIATEFISATETDEFVIGLTTSRPAMKASISLSIDVYVPTARLSRQWRIQLWADRAAASPH